MDPIDIVLEFARAVATGDPHAFRFGPQAYIVRTARGGYGSSELPWDGALLGKLAGLRLPGHDPALLGEVGEILRGFLAPAGWELHEQQISSAVQQGRPVFVTIRSAAAELFALPWELLTLRASGQALGGMPGVLVRYEWPETATARRSTAGRWGRALVVWSAAGGAVPAADHVNALRAAAAGDGVTFEPEADVLARASPGRIAAALANRARTGDPVSILHLLCHGGARGSVFGLMLDGEGEDDAPTLLDPSRLQQLFAPYAGTLRLIVLAACDSGNQGEFGARISSCAQMLHRAGLAAVVASRYPLSIAGSVRLSDAFYAALGEGDSLEQAFLRGRMALASDTASLDWASVQLYARAADGSSIRPLVGPQAAPSTVTTPSRRPALLFGIASLAAIFAVFMAVISPQTTADPPLGSTTAEPTMTTTMSAETTATTATTAGPASSSTTTTAGPAPSPTTTTTAETANMTTTTEQGPPTTTTTSGPTSTAGSHTSGAATVPRQSRPCPQPLKDYLVSALTTTKAGMFVIKVSKDGKATAPKADDDVREALVGVNAGRIKGLAAGSLPCHFMYGS